MGLSGSSVGRRRSSRAEAECAPVAFPHPLTQVERELRRTSTRRCHTSARRMKGRHGTPPHFHTNAPGEPDATPSTLGSSRTAMLGARLLYYSVVSPASWYPLRSSASGAGEWRHEAIVRIPMIPRERWDANAEGEQPRIKAARPRTPATCVSVATRCKRCTAIHRILLVNFP